MVLWCKRGFTRCGLIVLLKGFTTLFWLHSAKKYGFFLTLGGLSRREKEGCNRFKTLGMKKWRRRWALLELS